MIRILLFTGSRRGRHSHTAYFSKLVADHLCAIAETEGVSADYELITGEECRPEYCLGCENCFKRGVCPLDSVDDLWELKQKILECDILLFGSPVYCASMSGLSKTVLDRMGYWTHRFELAGKPTAVLVTTSGSFGQETADAISLLFKAMGASVAYAGYAVRHYGEPNLNLPEVIGPETERIAQKLWDCYLHPEAYIQPSQESAFRYFKRKAMQVKALSELLEKDMPAEKAVIYERRMFDYETYTDYVRYLTQQRRQ